MTPCHFVWQTWHLVTIDLQFAWHAWHLAILGDINFRFAWDAWHLRDWAASGGALGSGCRRDFHFAWHAWHLWHSDGFGGAHGSCSALLLPRLFAWQTGRLVTWTFASRRRHGHGDADLDIA